MVRLNRALAVAERDGPGIALALLDEVAGDARLAQYQPYWAAHADLLARTGAKAAADRAYEVAIGLEKDAAVRRFLAQRRAALG